MSAQRDDDDAAWLARQIDGDEETAADRDDRVPVEPEADPGAGDEPDAGVVDLDAPAETDGTTGARRYDHRVAAWFGGLVAAALLVALIVSVGFYQGGRHSAPAAARDAVSEPAAAALTPAPLAAPTDTAGADRPLPYTADAAGSCPPGSTSAQTMTGSDPRNAFVCVRGGVDGQVVTIDLSKTCVITAVSLTPGWVGQDSSGVSQWSQHRVVTLVQYTFNDTDKTLITQDTGNVHGEAVKPVKHVLASRITMLIRQTSRPPADPPATTSAPAGGLSGIFGTDAPQPSASPASVMPLVGEQAASDPVDATFAISSFKVIGHEAL